MLEPSSNPEQTNLFRSGSEMVLTVEGCAQKLKTLQEVGIFNIIFVEDSRIYKFKLNEIEYCWSDDDRNFFASSDPQQITILNPQFYQDLDQAFAEERKKSLIQAIKSDNIKMVQKFLEAGFKPFYETTEELASGAKHTENQDIIDLVNRYKIMWIIEQIMEDDVKEIVLHKFAKIYNHQDRETCLNAIRKLQHVWLGSMDEDGKVNSAEIADIWMGEGFEGYTLSKILAEIPPLNIKERMVLSAVISSSDFSSYDEEKLQEEAVPAGFTRDMVRVISALRNIFDEKNRENFLRAGVEEVEDSPQIEQADDQNLVPGVSNLAVAAASAVQPRRQKKCEIL